MHRTNNELLNKPFSAWRETTFWWLARAYRFFQPQWPLFLDDYNEHLDKGQEENNCLVLPLPIKLPESTIAFYFSHHVLLHGALWPMSLSYFTTSDEGSTYRVTVRILWSSPLGILCLEINQNQLNFNIDSFSPSKTGFTSLPEFFWDNVARRGWTHFPAQEAYGLKSAISEAVESPPLSSAMIYKTS